MESGMARQLSVSFDFTDDGYHYSISPPGMPASVVVEVLINFLEDMKGLFDATPVLNPDDARAWQMLGRLD
jgi:hypothetical protein